jgi:hypothetical protein
MGNLVLSGRLNFMGSLDLKSSGGTVKIDGDDVMVQGSGAQAQAAAPVILPPPPASPVTTSLDVTIIVSFNTMVKVAGKTAIALGMVLQGAPSIWPGMVLPSTKNTGPVTAGGIPINVVGDRAAIFPNGGSATFDTSGQ